ncbi:MAG: hypothetical protein KC933_23775 [Myxococcales bacterium]|nr:hypothetical protein [Myxococcales bacterium]
MSQNPFQTPSAPDPFMTAPVDGRTNDGRIDLGEAISAAWQSMTANAGVAIGGLLLVGVLSVLSYITVIGIFVLLPVVMYGGIRLFLNLADGQGEIGDVFDGFRNFGTALLPMLLLFLMYLAAMIPAYGLMIGGAVSGKESLMVVGQVYSYAVGFGVMIRMVYAPFFVVDQGMGAVDAVKAAWAATSGQYWIALALAIVAGIIGAAGMIALFIGMFFTIPLSYLIYTHAYRQMAG